MTTTNTKPGEIKIASNPTRCCKCGRFIPEGYAVRMIKPGELQCVTHTHGTVSIDKGAAPWRDNEYTKPVTRKLRRFELADA